MKKVVDEALARGKVVPEKKRQIRTPRCRSPRSVSVDDGVSSSSEDESSDSEENDGVQFSSEDESSDSEENEEP